MKIKDKILIIEDDIGIARFITAVLQADNYEPILARNAEEGCTMFSSHCPDVIILDLGLPDKDGVHVIKYVRELSRVPIIVVSARTHEDDKVNALDCGADDYIVKPFGTSELLARIRTALRHTRIDSTSDGVARDGVFKSGGIEIDYAKHTVTVDSEDVKLTLNEFKIVCTLAKYAGRVVTYDYLMKQIWGPNAESDNRILRVNMANIRRKIEKNPAEPKYIFTEVGVGYRMIDEQ